MSTSSAPDVGWSTLLQSLVSGLTLVVLVYLALCGGLYLFQRTLIYFPQPRSGVEPHSTLMLPVAGAELVVTVRPRPGSSAVLYFGGNAEDVAASLPDMSRDFADQAVYLMHYRGYGGSTGRPSEAALVADALALFDKVRVDHPDITVVGRSLGSGVAIQLASQRPVARLVLVTPYNSLQELAARQFPIFPVRWMLKDKFESWKYAGQLAMPTLLLLAEHDEVIPRASSDALYGHFSPGVASRQVLVGTGHNTIGQSPAYAPLLSGAP